MPAIAFFEALRHEAPRSARTRPDRARDPGLETMQVVRESTQPTPAQR